jgi:RNA-binding protein YlmH
MNREILNDYKDKDDKILLAQILDKVEMVEKKNKIEYTDFLDLAQIELVQKFINKIKLQNYMIYGGFEQAERKMFVIYPDKFNSVVVEKNLSNIVQIIRIELPDDLKGKYTHRDYLGAVIKLGIERKKVGDIIVDQNGADIIVDKDVVKFLLDNLGSLTRFSKSTISVQNIEDLRTVEIKKEELEIIVSSMRLDNVISDLARCSRNKALDIINTERVFINFECETKKTKQVKTGDMITIRGKGRFFVKEIIGQTRSGRTVIKIEKFV